MDRSSDHATMSKLLLEHVKVSKELRLFFANLRHKLDERQEMLEDELERMFCDAANHAIDGLATYGTKRELCNYELDMSFYNTGEHGFEAALSHLGSILRSQRPVSPQVASSAQIATDTSTVMRDLPELPDSMSVIKDLFNQDMNLSPLKHVHSASVEMENSAYPQTTVIHVIGYKPATPFQSSNGQRYPKLRDSIDVMKARSATKSPEFRTSPLTPGLTEIGRSLAFKVVAAFKGNLWRAFWKSRKVTTAVQRYKDMRSVLGQLENEETSGPVELNLKSTLEKQLQDAKRDVQILLSLTFQQRKDIMEEERNRKSFTIKNILTVANSGKKKKRPSMRTSIVKVQRRSHVGKLCLSPVSALPHVPFPQHTTSAKNRTGGQIPSKRLMEVPERFSKKSVRCSELADKIRGNAIPTLSSLAEAHPAPLLNRTITKRHSTVQKIHMTTPKSKGSMLGMKAK